MILEIGTSDFRTLAGKVDGIFIEPVKYYFDRLPNCNKENVAISNYTGSINIYYLTDEEIKKFNLPDWIRGCASIGQIHPAIINKLKEVGAPINSVRIDKVKVVRIKSIIEKYKICSLELLKIDTEGHDSIILNDFLDTVSIRPIEIQFEANSLSQNKDIFSLLNRLKTEYTIIRKGSNIFCKIKKENKK
jgi:FkbM family methyltransferase